MCDKSGGLSAKYLISFIPPSVISHNSGCFDLKFSYHFNTRGHFASSKSIASKHIVDATRGKSAIVSSSEKKQMFILEYKNYFYKLFTLFMSIFSSTEFDMMQRIHAHPIIKLSRYERLVFT